MALGLSFSSGSNNEIIDFCKFDARAGLSWEGLPEGARATALGIEWNPTGDQVGFSEVVALLKHGELE